MLDKVDAIREEYKQSRERQNRQGESNNNRRIGLTVRKIVIKSIISLYAFLKNQENIIKCLVLATALIFFSQCIASPKVSKKDLAKFFDWLKVNPESRLLILTGCLSIISFFW